MIQTATSRVLSNWPDTLTDPAAFDREQGQLSQVWTFLGMAQDLASDGDWFRVTLASRSVFVQRFGHELRGFENRCAHRSFPLRTADRGNGPIVCGFHHWRYDREGLAVGVPKCRELFGVHPRELGALLNPVEIATCGNLIFGRMVTAGGQPSLEQFLGEGFPILAAMSRSMAKPERFGATVKANWRLCFHISIDDYHLAAVHPTTFGARAGYLKRENIGYFRFGWHSAYLATPDPEAFARLGEDCRSGAYQSKNYGVFHVFPNLTVSHFRADGQHWYITVLQYAPTGVDSSTMRAWLFPAPFRADLPWHDRWTRPVTEPVRRLVLRHYVRRVLGEDNLATERLQSIARQSPDAPLLGALEERIGWFEETYTKATAA